MPKGDGREPGEVVKLFLEGMQKGDLKATQSMLTEKARQHGVVSDEPHEGHFKVGETEMDGEKSARVAAAWFRPTEDGSTDVIKSIWVLRREPEGFRICGTFMIVPELENEYVSLDFEDPDHMDKTRAQVEQRLVDARKQENGPSVARKPQNDPAAERR